MSKMSSYFLHLQDTGVIAYEPEEYYDQFNAKNNNSNHREGSSSTGEESTSRPSPSRDGNGGLLPVADGDGQRQPSGADIAPEDQSIPE